MAFRPLDQFRQTGIAELTSPANRHFLERLPQLPNVTARDLRHFHVTMKLDEAVDCIGELTKSSGRRVPRLFPPFVGRAKAPTVTADGLIRRNKLRTFDDLTLLPALDYLRRMDQPLQQFNAKLAVCRRFWIEIDPKDLQEFIQLPTHH